MQCSLDQKYSNSNKPILYSYLFDKTEINNINSNSIDEKRLWKFEQFRDLTVIQFFFVTDPVIKQGEVYKKQYNHFKHKV